MATLPPRSRLLPIGVRMSQYAQAVLFDIGNVLFCDPWEALILTPQRGLAATHGWDRSEAEAAGRHLWDKFSIAEYDEAEYWQDYGSLLGTDISPTEVKAAERELLVSNPLAATMLTAAQASGRAVGIASNNTSFWFAKQWDALNLGRYVDTDLVFVSQLLGVNKDFDGKGLYEIAAEHLAPESVLVIDDRPENVKRARSVGFSASFYSFSDASPLPAFE